MCRCHSESNAALTSLAEEMGSMPLLAACNLDLGPLPAAHANYCRADKSCPLQAITKSFHTPAANSTLSAVCSCWGSVLPAYEVQAFSTVEQPGQLHAAVLLTDEMMNADCACTQRPLASPSSGVGHQSAAGAFGGGIAVANSYRVVARCATTAGTLVCGTWRVQMFVCLVTPLLNLTDIPTAAAVELLNLLCSSSTADVAGTCVMFD